MRERARPGHMLGLRRPHQDRRRRSDFVTENRRPPRPFLRTGGSNPAVDRVDPLGITT
jgi:hypothetical protein